MYICLYVSVFSYGPMCLRQINMYVCLKFVSTVVIVGIIPIRRKHVFTQ